MSYCSGLGFTKFQVAEITFKHSVYRTHNDFLLVSHFVTNFRLYAPHPTVPTYLPVVCEV